MKTIILILSLFFSCNTRTPNNEIINNPAIQKDSLKVQNKVNINDNSFKGYKPSDTLNVISKFLFKSIKNHSVLHWKKGDINNDNIDDFVIILQNEYPNKELIGMENSYSRMVVLLETIKNYPNFKLASINHHILECSNCGGAGVEDPLVGVSIKNNYFSFEQLFGACDKSFIVITFKYENDKWFLHKIGQDDYSCNQVNQNGEIEMTHKTKTKKDFGLIEFKNYK